MAQINTANPPQYNSDSQLTATKLKTNSEASSSTPLSEANAPQDDLQLTKLSGVLNSLKKGASTMRNQVAQVMTSVRSGAYQVDSIQVSRSIVGESLASR